MRRASPSLRGTVFIAYGAGRFNQTLPPRFAFAARLQLKSPAPVINSP
jgi:hypothetical protein